MEGPGYSTATGRPHLIDEYRETCTFETAACIEGLSMAGFNRIHVYESHPRAVISHLLPEGVTFSRAMEESEYFSVSQYHWDGVVLLGAHAATGTPNATLCHTLSDINPQIWRINGIEAGEIGLQTTMLSVEKSPILMVTGGTCLANEVAYWCPAAHYVIVKRDEGWNRAISLPKDEAVKRIRDAAEALRIQDFKDLPVKPPYSIELHLLGGSPRRLLFRTAWLLNRLLLNDPMEGTFSLAKGSVVMRGEDPRVLIGALLGRSFLER
jgi:D-aminopeptidase